MFYSTRYFIRIVIILILVSIILRYLPTAMAQIEHFLTFVFRLGSRLLRNIGIR